MVDGLQARVLRQEIEQTRAELGQTVEALAAKVDVKARARQAKRDATDFARTQISLARGGAGRSPVAVVLLAGAAAGLLAIAIARLVDRRRRG